MMTKETILQRIGELTVANEAYYTKSFLTLIYRVAYGDIKKETEDQKLSAKETIKDIDGLNDFLQELGLIPKDKTIIQIIKGE